MIIHPIFFGRREGKSGRTSLILRLRWDGDAQYLKKYQPRLLISSTTKDEMVF